MEKYSKITSNCNVMFINRSYSYLIIIVIFSIGLLSGCEDQLLNQTPRGELTDPSFFETEEHAIQATNATYATLRDYNAHSLPWIGMTEVASDDADKGSSTSDSPEMQAIDNFTFTPTNGLFGGPWDGYFQGIFRANLAINGIPNVESISDNISDRLIGENKFLRAYYYFFLVRAYGGVPILLKNKEVGDSFEIPRSSADSVYAQIETDLQDAVEALPLKSEYAASEMGRATQGAAQALLAKVHLFQDEYQEAEQLARSVIESGEYSLYPNYNGIFSREGENSSESVFEVQAVALETGEGGSQYSQVQGVRGNPNLGWGFNNPSADLLNAYEAGDPRLGATVMFVHEILPSEEDVVRDNPNMIDERYNQKSFIPINNPGGSDNGGVNIRRIRYADVLLMAAEAAFQNGNEGDARNWVNQVRQRARGDRSATLGIQVEPLTQLVADTLGLSSEIPGAFIRLAKEEGTGASAGLKSFNFQLVNDGNVIQINNIDIIQTVDGVEVTSSSEFYTEMESKSAGQTVMLNILRVNQTYNNQLNTSTETLQVSVSAEELLPDFTASGQPLLEAIWHERRVELAMEQQRFFDLVRQGRAAEVLQGVGKDFVSGKHELYPIPQDEIDLSGLDQNNGY
jgi:hypothetical protein